VKGLGKSEENIFLKENIEMRIRNCSKRTSNQQQKNLKYVDFFLFFLNVTLSFKKHFASINSKYKSKNSKSGITNRQNKMEYTLIVFKLCIEFPSLNDFASLDVDG
jgi:hypothetical protein